MHVRTGGKATCQTGPGNTTPPSSHLRRARARSQRWQGNLEIRSPFQTRKGNIRDEKGEQVGVSLDVTSRYAAPHPAASRLGTWGRGRTSERGGGPQQPLCQDGLAAGISRHSPRWLSRDPDKPVLPVQPRGPVQPRSPKREPHGRDGSPIVTLFHVAEAAGWSRRAAITPSIPCPSHADR